MFLLLIFSVGLRAARVHVIFELPPQFGIFPHPLAYIEWYTLFRQYDKDSSMYLVSRSTRDTYPNTAVVSVEHIYRLCHLVGRMRAEVDKNWTQDNVLDKADTLFVNPYLTIDLFSSRTPLFK